MVWIQVIRHMLCKYSPPVCDLPWLCLLQRLLKGRSVQVDEIQFVFVFLLWVALSVLNLILTNVQP